MAKKARPSFSATKPASRPSTGWVYKTEPGIGHPVRPRRAGRTATVRTPTESETADTAEAVDTPDTVHPHHERALAIVAKYATASAAASLVPLPWLDLAAVGGVHMAMIGALAKEYDQPFEERAFAAVLSSFGGASAAGWVARGCGRSLLKMIPGVGTWIATLSMPGFASAMTYAIGRAFITHFESGGPVSELSLNEARARLRGESAESTV